MDRPRPTIRCLREELGYIKLPPASEPLDRLNHPLLNKASGQFASSTASHPRIVAIDDAVFFKVKVGRWRGAVWQDRDRPWIVAAGTREQGSIDDFYEELVDQAKRARAIYNTTHSQSTSKVCYTGNLLPTTIDEKRLILEAAARSELEIAETIHRLLHESILSGHPKRDEVAGGCTVEILVRAREGETYVSMRVHGSVPGNIQAVVLDSIPGCDRDAWYPDFMPDRPIEPNELVWSNIMDPQVAGQLLNTEDP